MNWTGTPTPLDTGTQALVYHMRPDRPTPRAMVHINHGMAEHAGRYGRFAHALADAGYAVVAQDHRGHGGTTRGDTSLGHFGLEGLSGVLDDMYAVQENIRSVDGNVPIVTFGHSMGSILTLAFAMERPSEVDAIACWNSGAEGGAQLTAMRTILKVQRAFKGSDVPSGLAQKLTFEAWNKRFAPNRTDFDWLSRDEAEVDAYIADPLCGFPVTIGVWLAVTQAVAIAAKDDNLAKILYTTPVHLVGGADDPCTDNGSAMEHLAERMKAQGMNDVTLDLLPDTRHESLNETNRDETVKSFIAWLDARFA